LLATRHDAPSSGATAVTGAASGGATPFGDRRAGRISMTAAILR